MVLILINISIFIIFIFLYVRFFIYYRSVLSFRELLRNVNIGYARIRQKNNIIIDINMAMLRILGISEKRKDVIGSEWMEFFLLSDKQKIANEESIEKGGKRVQLEYSFKTLNGDKKWVRQHAILKRDVYTRDVIMELLIEDITSEKESYQKMLETEQRYEKLFKNSGDTVILYNVEKGIIEEVNPVTEVVFGYLQKEMLGNPFLKFIHPSSRKMLEEKQEEMLVKGVVHVELVMVRKDGMYREAGVTLSKFSIKNKNIVMAVIKDISELVREREELKKRQIELEQFHKAALMREERIRELKDELCKVQKWGEKGKNKGTK